MTKEEEKYTTLDTEQCKWWVNTLFNMAKEQACNSHNFDDGEEIQSAQDKIIKVLEQDNEEIFKQFKKKVFLESEDVLGNEMIDSYMVIDYLAELMGVEND